MISILQSENAKISAKQISVRYFAKAKIKSFSAKQIYEAYFAKQKREVKLLRA